MAYPDWRTLLERLSREARAAKWRGPLVLDEFPYLVVASPELPSVVQAWIDHDAKDARLVVAIAGSSQRMMHGLALSAEAPLFGRASETLEITPLSPRHLPAALGCGVGCELVEAYAAWGGVPRYWELAAEERGSTALRIDRLALDPLGPLHREPDRLLKEEVPSAQEVRPVLDAIGSGAHRVSEIAGRLNRPATSMAHPLKRLVDMGYARRDVPFGVSERQSRRALYRIDDPFVRLWFRVVAPKERNSPVPRHRGGVLSLRGSGRTSSRRSPRASAAAATPRSSRSGTSSGETGHEMLHDRRRAARSGAAGRRGGRGAAHARAGGQRGARGGRADPPRPARGLCRGPRARRCEHARRWPRARADARSPRPSTGLRSWRTVAEKKSGPAGRYHRAAHVA